MKASPEYKKMLGTMGGFLQVQQKADCITNMDIVLIQDKDQVPPHYFLKEL